MKKSIRPHIDRWRNDYNFKTLTNSAVSFFVTALFALYNGFLGIYHSSVWNGSICVYYLLLLALRGMILRAEKRASALDSAQRAPIRRRAFIFSSVVLLFLNLALIAPVTLLVKLQKPVNMTLIPAIAAAAYTTFKIVMASVNVKRSRRSENVLVKELRTINFIDALVSILTLQNTLITVNSGPDGGGSSMLVLSAITGAAILLAIVAISAVSLRRGIRKTE